MAEGYRFSALQLLVRLPIRTLLHTFDFSSRSTRTETFFWLIVAQMLVGLAVSMLIQDSIVSHEVAEKALLLIFFIPFVALAARRLNDQERTRWWLLLLPLGLVDEATGLFPGFPAPPPWIFGVTNIIAVIGIFGLLFLETGTPGPNRFGENPRTALTYS